MRRRSSRQWRVRRRGSAVVVAAIAVASVAACGTNNQEPARDSASPDVSLNVTTPSVGGGTTLASSFPTDRVPLPKGPISRAVDLESGWAFTVGGKDAFAQGVQLLESSGFSRLADAEMSRRAVFTGKGLSVVMVDSSINPGQTGAQYTVTKVDQ